MLLPCLASLASVQPLLSPSAMETISRGQVHVVENWLPPRLVAAMRRDAEGLHGAGLFSPDGLTNNAKAAGQQGFTASDRQTFRGDAWTARVGDLATRLEFAERMRQLRRELAAGLGRPTLAAEGARSHEMSYNWYEPGASLGRHLDEHHEETKGPKGWGRPTRRSVTWLVYLNREWGEKDGGALRTFPRAEAASGAVGAHEGNLQVGWFDARTPVFLDAFGEGDEGNGLSMLYVVRGEATTGEAEGSGRLLLSRGFEVPPQPVDFGRFVHEAARPRFEQISRSRSLEPTAAAPRAAQPHRDVVPAAGKLVLFDSVTMPHLVREVESSRQRVAATGWFHEDSQFWFRG